MPPTIGFLKKITAKLSRSGSNNKSKNTSRDGEKNKASQVEKDERRTRKKHATPPPNVATTREVPEDTTTTKTLPSPDTIPTEGKKNGGQVAKTSGQPKRTMSGTSMASNNSRSPNWSKEAMSSGKEEIEVSGIDTTDEDRNVTATSTPTVVVPVTKESPAPKSPVPKECPLTEQQEQRKKQFEENREKLIRDNIKVVEDDRRIEKEGERKKRSKENDKEKKVRSGKNDKEEKRSKPKKEKKASKRKRDWRGLAAGIQFYYNNQAKGKIKAEYTLVKSLTSDKTTEAFDANTERNRDHAPKIYDDNRIVLSGAGQDYINASVISVKDFSQKIIVAQLPRMENESFVEDFWQMIYQEQITLIYLLVSDDIIKQAPTPLFKFETGEYQYIGKMFINNRRTEPDGDPRKYTIEVLPEGNSDSVMCQVHHHTTWLQREQPPKPNRIIKMIHEFLTEKEIQSANVCVVSELGSGRACSFIGSLIAISQLNRNIEPNIGQIMTNIQQQRPGAVESFDQYAGIYVVVLDYIARKQGSKSNPINEPINDFIDRLANMDLSPSAKQ